MGAPTVALAALCCSPSPTRSACDVPGGAALLGLPSPRPRIRESPSRAIVARLPSATEDALACSAMGLQPSDAELVRCIADGAGDARSAEAELCLRFVERVRLYGLRHLRTEERAADLAQSVLLAVLEAARAGRLQDHERVDRFVLGTCRH